MKKVLTLFVGFAMAIGVLGVANTGVAATTTVVQSDYIPLVGRGTTAYNTTYSPGGNQQNIVTDGGEITLTASSGQTTNVKWRVFIPPGTKWLDASLFTFANPVETKVAARFSEPPVASVEEIYQDESFVPSDALSRLLANEELSYLSPIITFANGSQAGSGTLRLAARADNATISTKGGWAYFNTLQSAGGYIKNADIRLVVDETCYRSWFANAKFDSSGNPVEGATHTCSGTGSEGAGPTPVGPALTAISLSKSSLNQSSTESVTITPTPSTAALTNCAAVNSFGGTSFLANIAANRITLDPSALNISQDTQLTIRCGSVSAQFTILSTSSVLTSLTLSPASVVKSSTSTVNITPVPPTAALPACKVFDLTGNTSLLASSVGTRLYLLAAARNITTNQTVRVQCGTVSKNFEITMVAAPPALTGISLSASSISKDSTSTIQINAQPSGAVLPNCYAIDAVAQQTSLVQGSITNLTITGSTIALDSTAKALTTPKTVQINCGAFKANLQITVPTVVPLTGISLSTNSLDKLNTTTRVAITPSPSTATLPTCSATDSAGIPSSLVSVSTSSFTVAPAAAGISTAQNITIRCGTATATFQILSSTTVPTVITYPAYKPLVGSGAGSFRSTFAPTVPSIAGTTTDTVRLISSVVNTADLKWRLFVPPGTKSLTLDVQMRPEPTATKIALRFLQPPVATTGTNMVTTETLRVLLNNDSDLLFVSPVTLPVKTCEFVFSGGTVVEVCTDKAAAGASAISLSVPPTSTTYRSEIGGWIYINAQQIPGNIFSKLAAEVVVDKVCYNSWFQAAKLDAAGNPVEGVKSTCANSTPLPVPDPNALTRLELSAYRIHKTSASAITILPVPSTASLPVCRVLDAAGNESNLLRVTGNVITTTSNASALATDTPLKIMCGTTATAITVYIRELVELTSIDLSAMALEKGSVSSVSIAPVPSNAVLPICTASELNGMPSTLVKISGNAITLDASANALTSSVTLKIGCGQATSTLLINVPQDKEINVTEFIEPDGTFTLKVKHLPPASDAGKNVKIVFGVRVPPLRGFFITTEMWFFKLLDTEWAADTNPALIAMPPFTKLDAVNYYTIKTGLPKAKVMEKGIEVYMAYFLNAGTERKLMGRLFP